MMKIIIMAMMTEMTMFVMIIMSIPMMVIMTMLMMMMIPDSGDDDVEKNAGKRKKRQVGLSRTKN